MAFAHKAKKKTRTSKSSSRKNQADPIFSPLASIFSRKHRYFLPSVPTFSSSCAIQIRTAPPPRETRGGDEQEWRRTIALYARASVDFRKRSSPFTDDYNPLSGRHLRVKAFENRKVHDAYFSISLRIISTPVKAR